MFLRCPPHLYPLQEGSEGDVDADEEEEEEEEEEEDEEVSQPTRLQYSFGHPPTNPAAGGGQ